MTEKIDWKEVRSRILETPVVVPPKKPSRKVDSEKSREKGKRFYDAHKDDPVFKEKKSVSNKAYKDAHKDDPEYKANKSEYNKLYKLAHKDDPVFKAKRAEACRRYRAKKRLAA